MMSANRQYSHVPLKTITTKVGSGATPRGGQNSYKSSGISLTRSLNVYDFRFDPGGLAFIDDVQAAQLKNVEVQSQDILLNITGASVARCCIVPEQVLPARVNQHVSIVRIDQSKADPRYVLYTINSPHFKSHLLTIAQWGATREALTKAKIEDFEIPLPSLATQRKIAAILSAYDELIENNLQRIKILEEMAQRLYREWFVHFRFPGHERVPLVDSPLGKIPEGWEVGTLNDALVLQRGFDLPKKLRKPGNIPIYAATGLNGFHNEAKVKGPGVITGRSGSLGKVTYVVEDFWPLNTTLWVKEFRKATPLFAYYLLSDLNFEQFNSGAAVPTLNRNDVHGLPVVLPHESILRMFDDSVDLVHFQN